MIRLKAFTLQKDGAPYTNQDRLAINIAKRRFAVADGVSNSYYPEIMAEALCRSFIDDEAVLTVDWPSIFKERICKKVSAYWEKEVDEIEAGLDILDLRHAKIQREEFTKGASTFAGVEIDEKEENVYFHVVGDSCVFVLPDNEPIQVYCACPKVEYSGKPYCLFKPDTQAIVADGNDNYQWVSGSTSMKSGYVILMTDGIAKWFQDLYFADLGAAQMLWDTNNHVLFEELVNKYRCQNEMDDDITVLMLRFDGGQNVGIDPLVVDVWEWYPMTLIQLESAPVQIPMEKDSDISSVSDSKNAPVDTEGISPEKNGIIYQFVKMLGDFKSIWISIFGQTKSK